MRYIEDLQSNVSSNVTINNSSIIVTRDTRKLFVDVNGTRYEISDIIDIPEDSTISDIVNPIGGKIYYEKSSDSFYINHDGIWNDITSSHPSISMEKGYNTIQALEDKDTFTVVDSFKRDEYGHVIQVNTKTYSLPESTHPAIVFQSNTSSEQQLNPEGSFTVIDSISKDSNGHIQKYNVKTVTLPSKHIDTNKGSDITKEKVINSGNYLTAIDSIQLDSYGHITSITTTKYRMNTSGGTGGSIQNICGITLLNSIKGGDLEYTTGIDNTNSVLVLLDTGDTFYETSSLDIFGLNLGEDVVYTFKQVGENAYILQADTSDKNYTRKIINSQDSGWNRTTLDTSDLFSTF